MKKHFCVNQSKPVENPFLCRASSPALLFNPFAYHIKDSLFFEDEPTEWNTSAKWKIFSREIDGDELWAGFFYFYVRLSFQWVKNWVKTNEKLIRFFDLPGSFRVIKADKVYTRRFASQSFFIRKSIKKVNNRGKTNQFCLNSTQHNTDA